MNKEASNNAELLMPYLVRFPAPEHQVWVDEAVRLSMIIIKFQGIERKWKYNKLLKRNYFTKEVVDLCKEAACTNIIITAREPSRARPPSPYTIDRWSKNFSSIGLRAFLRAPSEANPQIDNRRVSISVEAVKWVNENWRKFTSPTALFNALSKEAEINSLKIPSKSWVYRRWKEIPKIVSTYLFDGADAYQSKFAPYLPRDMNDLDALQVLCGDHREGDVTVHVGKGKLARLWLTYWLCLRTSLIWGWYLSLTPNSEAIALAYAHGISRFGAQPFSRPEDEFYSYIYTDRGKSYRSHDIEGKTIEIHKNAANISGGLEYFLVEKNIGLVEDFKIQQLLAKARNPKEKPIERTNKDFSAWEKNEFEGYCGDKPSNRPDTWYRLFKKHNELEEHEYDKSPFISLKEYKAKIAARIDEHNTTVHERTNLGGRSIIPIKEYESLYTTRYKIKGDLVATLLLKSAVKTIRKNGINCFRKNWSYWHDSMSELKGLKVQIKYTDQDYERLWIILPSGDCVEAELIEPSPFRNPNKESLKKTKQMEKLDKANIQNFQLLSQSKLRFETTEERITNSQNKISLPNLESLDKKPKATVHLFPTIAKTKFTKPTQNQLVSVDDVKSAESNTEILSEIKIIRVNEFD